MEVSPGRAWEFPDKAVSPGRAWGFPGKAAARAAAIGGGLGRKASDFGVVGGVALGDKVPLGRACG
jgi:hypothetical protein